MPQRKKRKMLNKILCMCGILSIFEIHAYDIENIKVQVCKLKRLSCLNRYKIMDVFTLKFLVLYNDIQDSLKRTYTLM